ncbi:MAG: hypothetical protein OEM94_06995 [Acidimicrobiia bacterium]|nr:hypothetical protein [Acidimicrobiia bacterium]
MSEPIGIRPSVSDATRRALETVGDHLIPEAHGMPAAGSMDVGTTQLDAVLASRPDLAPHLERAMADANLDDIGGFVTTLESEDPEAYGAVTLAIVAGYYMHPEVHRLIGYQGQVPKDAQRLSEAEIFQEGLMDLAQKVIERGPIYRPTPTTEGAI